MVGWIFFASNFHSRHPDIPFFVLILSDLCYTVTIQYPHSYAMLYYIYEIWEGINYAKSSF